MAALHVRKAALEAGVHATALTGTAPRAQGRDPILPGCIIGRDSAAERLAAEC